MNNSNNIAEAERILNGMGYTAKVKYLKKDKGLLEKENNNDEKIILAEDNRQILLG